MASPFEEIKLQQTANMCRFERIGAAEANFAKRRFFVRAEWCEHAPHDPLPLHAPSLGNAARLRQGLLPLHSFNPLRLGLDGGSLGKQGFPVSVQGYRGGHPPDECRELALVTRFRPRLLCVFIRTPTEG